jgi:hypothetical protein
MIMYVEIFKTDVTVFICVRHTTYLPLFKEAQYGHNKILISIINQHEAITPDNVMSSMSLQEIIVCLIYIAKMTL